ncbi:DUF221 domain-containing protein [Diaporthe amygdali]|uniref:DUF221 domain-containing protein n=1 Tax=Phomopsis amygdali TaxID=1214568 RepID=UPI0022FDC24F|nr:DUF221 domain-containing protein [Diaporthe amygdali]KAJ0118093.1 DUF221 domain-containing protein [Diaporthe amygdali]
MSDLSNITDPSAGTAKAVSGQGLETFLASVGVSVAVAFAQVSLFLLLRNKLARIYKPKSFLVPERERTEPPPASPWALIRTIMNFSDREIIKKCGLDAYFFMRYLKTLLVIFVPLACIILPILLPVNFIGGYGRNLWTNSTDADSDPSSNTTVVGLSTLSWSNVRLENADRRWAHLMLALVVIVWVCFVIFSEMRVYIKVRQDWLTSAEHRLRASANTVLVSSIPEKWLSEEALRGLFDVFPGGIRNIWLTRDFSPLLEKIKKREEIHLQLESAESDLIRKCKKNQLKKRDQEEKRRRKELRTNKPTKAEKLQRQKDEDEAARRRAETEQGISYGDHEETPHNAEQVAAEGTETNEIEPHRNGPTLNPFATVLDGGILKVGQGLKGGANKLGKAGAGLGAGLVGGISALGHGVDNELERSGGFEFVKPGAGPSAIPENRADDRPNGPTDKRVQILVDKPKQSFATERSQTPSEPYGKESMQQELHPTHYGNTVRKLENVEDLYVKEETRWWQFWKPPSGGYASPVPQGAENNEYPFTDQRSLWAKIKQHIPFMGEEEEKLEYPPFVNPGQEEDYQERAGAEWEKWIKPKDRPHHRLAIFEWTPGWLPGLPLLNKKVDTIYWCRKELARWNVEIEEDQKNSERFPIMTSAFIQFNNQVAAHMACQSAIHHIPKTMAPRVVEISPDDVIWDNMAMSWWMQWTRVLLACGFVFGMIILWTFPVAFSAGLASIDDLISKYEWLSFLKVNEKVHDFVKLAAGVLPPVLLAVLLALVPLILGFVAEFQGVKTGSSKSEWVQTYYFFFLFVQVFLVVSVSTSAINTLLAVAQHVEELPTILAQNLPDSANYFFSYLVLQGASVSSGTLLQVAGLAMWYILSRLFDNTVRAKFKRQISLPQVSWGSFFPVYTNFACIAIIFSVIAPLMTVFAIINFSMLWCAHRYNMLYVTRFRTDTGGVLYPRALNQTFTGLYVMEICLLGLFLIQSSTCYPQAIIMVIAVALTALYQVFLNREFGPLTRHLPITFEDEAVLRDQAFQKAQDRRLGIITDDDEATTLRSIKSYDDKDIEMQDLDGNGGRAPHSQNEHDASPKTHRKNLSSGGGSLRSKLINPVSTLKHAGTWAVQSGNTMKNATLGRAEENLKTAAEYRRQRRGKELEAQRAIGEALYGGFADEIEDLTPEERNQLVQKAFTHSAVRARRPVVWIPRDDLGVSDDEVRRTNDYSEHIWISNEGTALDSKCRAVYGRAPPDFSELDLIQL